jgi:glycosyltransferase involved in cell wall biosynthesis
VHLLSVPAIEYSDPWDIGFDERLGALRSGSPRIAYYYAEPDTSTFRYRVFNMIEALDKSNAGASSSWLTAADGVGALEAVESADTLVVCRAMYTPHIAAVIARAKALDKRVVFDVDDLVFDPRFTHLIMETLDQTVDEEGLMHWFGRIARLTETLRHCDYAIATTDYLADRIRDVHDIETSIVPNFLNRAQLEVSERVMKEKIATGFARDGRIHLGYFSGTPTHNRDFAIIEPAVARLLDDDPRIHLLVVGFLDLGEHLLRHRHRVQMLPLQDFLNLQRLMGQVEINLVPLQDNEFTNCKSELKYFEAAVVGTVTVASPTYAFRRAISHGATGFLARSFEWEPMLRHAIEKLDDLPRIAQAAAEDAVVRYAPESQSGCLRDALLM